MLITESPANGPAQTGFVNYGYDKLAAKYGAKLKDLDDDDFETIWCFSERDVRPHPCRVGKSLLRRSSPLLSLVTNLSYRYNARLSRGICGRLGLLRGQADGRWTEAAREALAGWSAQLSDQRSAVSE